MVFYLGFRRFHECVIVENDLLKKKLEESQAKIKDLESKLEASQTMSECIQKDHSTIYGKFVFAREEANHLTTKLSYATDEMVVCRSKVETLLQSILTIKTKFRKAKEKLREYRMKAQSFYRQLTFAYWGRDTGFSMGYLGGFETFREWVKKPENFLQVDTISPKDVAPLKRVITNVVSVGQKEMPDCRGIKCMGLNCI
jgi:hypothetical protein